MYVITQPLHNEQDVIQRKYFFYQFSSYHIFLYSPPFHVSSSYVCFYFFPISHFISHLFFPLYFAGCPRGVMVKAMDCGIVVSKFVLQLRYYVHFRANTFGKGMNPLILPDMG